MLCILIDQRCRLLNGDMFSYILNSLKYQECNLCRNSMVFFDIVGGAFVEGPQNIGLPIIFKYISGRLINKGYTHLKVDHNPHIHRDDAMSFISTM
jgi:hypothetical protein